MITSSASRSPLSKALRLRINLRAVMSSEAHPLGMLPLLALTGASGLLIISLAFSIARYGVLWSHPLFWLGILVLFMPAGLRLISPQPVRIERIGIVLMLGLGMYLVKVMHSPIHFTFYDELLHWRAVQNIVESGHLFKPHSLLPVAPLYPGLHNANSAIREITGLSTFNAAILMIGVARMVVILMLFLLYEAISRSAWLAGVATLLYAGNPSFILFDSQFGYESLALAIAMLLLCVTRRRSNQHPDEMFGLVVITLLGMGAVTITHHVTSYFILIVLTLWTVSSLVLHSFNHSQFRPAWSQILMLVTILSWMIYVATITLDYLKPLVSSALMSLFKMILQEETGRELFSSGLDRMAAPLWERLIILASMGWLVVGLLWGTLAIWKERRYRTQAIYLTLIALGFGYPSIQVLRFTEHGPELAARFSPFLYVGLCFVIAFGITRLFDIEQTRAIVSQLTIWRLRSLITTLLNRLLPLLRRRLFVYSTLLLVAFNIFVGGVMVGAPPWSRVPGSYLITADTRSIEPKGIETAYWARDVLGQGQRLAADRINGLLMISYGGQTQVTGYFDKVNVPKIFRSPWFYYDERIAVCDGDIDYLVIDQRFSTDLPLFGYYYEIGEAGKSGYHEPLKPHILKKFDYIPGSSRVFDNGTIFIYDIRGVSCVY